MNNALEILKKTKKDKINQNMIINVWLNEFYNTDIEIIFKEKSSEYDSFYNDFPISQTQHDWWLKECNKILKNKFYKKLEQSLDYINVAPKVLK